MVHPGAQYSRAPITQAILEIQCEVSSDVDIDALQNIVNLNEFPRVEDAKHVQVDLGRSGETTSQRLGFVMHHKSGRFTVGSRSTGLSYTENAPYSGWEDFSSRALEFWSEYKKIARPTGIKRLGVRFVNQINIPKPQIEIKDYVRTAVDISPYLPQAVSGYFLQVTVPLDKFDSSATITSTITASKTVGTTSLILDIDAFQIVDISPEEAVSEDELCSRLNTLRDAKNYTFEACVTDATRGIIS